ncbi:MAG: IS200/IS605 family transposase [Cyanobacteriota bacterium]
MKFELLRSSHSVGEANYHIQLTPAYRRDIFADELTRILTRDYLIAAANKHGITIAAIGFGPDHCHTFTTRCKNHGPAQVAKLLKGFSSRMMRKHHRDLFEDKLYGKKFWTSGYFYRTVGAVNSATIRKYVEDSQNKHWEAEQGKQAKLLEFTAN